MAIAAAAGLSIAGQPEARESAGAGGWSVAWPRTLNGVAVRGDGLRISLWSDGSFHGLTRTERSLAARPGRTLTEGDARARATRFVAEQLGADRSALSVTTAEQAWVAPNGMFLAEAPDAPAAILRLAWIVRFDATGTTAERLRSVEIWLDAGDGTIIGGDVVE
jgi:hypothetical protein